MTRAKFNPPFGGLVAASGPGLAGAPHADNPYYVGYHEGLFIKKNMLIGEGLAKATKWSLNLPKLGSDTGIFTFDSEHKVPAKLMGQVVDFFTRTYDRQKTEAAVLLCMHRDTKEWRVFVPTQLVTHGGVNYVFEPLHIRPPWFIVGSIHSHCNFGAGHSSTDTGDATDFDGLHMTIGHIKDDIPEIVAMVAMNKQFMHFDKTTFPEIFDFSEVRQHKAPDWWDRYVEDSITKTKPVGFELYAKYQKATVVRDEKAKTYQHQPSPGYKPTNYDPDSWVYSESARGMVWQGQRHVGKAQDGVRETRPVRELKEVTTINGYRRFLSPESRIYCFDADEVSWAASFAQWLDGCTVQELHELGYRWDSVLSGWRFVDIEEASNGPRWGLEGELLPKEETKPVRPDFFDEDYWEDLLDDKTLVDAIYESDWLTEEEENFILENPEQAGTHSFWRSLAMKKMTNDLRIMRIAGIDATVTIHSVLEPATKKEPAKLLVAGQSVEVNGATITRKGTN